MPTSSSDTSASVVRYGPASFVALVVNMLVLEFITWLLMPTWYMLPVIVLPVVIVNALIGYALTKRHGVTNQVGRGMLIACISAPLSVVVFVLAFIVAKAIGPL